MHRNTLPQSGHRSRRGPAIALFSALLATALGLAPPSAAADEPPARTLEEEIPAKGTHAVKAKLKAGELLIEGWRKEEIQATVDIFCNSAAQADCRWAADRVRLVWKRKGGTVEIKITGRGRLRSRHIDVVARLKVPADLPLETDSGAGSVKIKDMKGDIEVDLGAGDVELELRKKAFRVVEMDVGAGSADLYLDGNRIEGSGFVHRGLTWRDGKGSSIVEIDIGAGDAVVRLD